MENNNRTSEAISSVQSTKASKEMVEELKAKKQDWATRVGGCIANFFCWYGY